MNGDIKLENMLFTTRENGTDNRLFDRAQICDFTMALKLDPATADTCMKSLGQATPLYDAPEKQSQFECKPKPVDVWAFGVSLYAFVFGKTPFGGTNLQEVSQNVRDRDVNFEQEELQVSDELKALLMAVLNKDPEQRPSIR